MEPEEGLGQILFGNEGVFPSSKGAGAGRGAQGASLGESFFPWSTSLDEGDCGLVQAAGVCTVSLVGRVCELGALETALGHS